MNTNLKLVFITLIIRVATSGISLFSFIFITHKISPEQYGQYAVVMVIQLFGGLILINPIGQYINRHIFDWYRKNILGKVYKKYLSYTIISGLICLIISFFILNIKVSSTDAIQLSIATGLVLISITWNTTLISTVNALKNKIEASLLQLITILISLIASVSFSMINPTALNWCLGLIFGNVIIIVYIYIRHNLATNIEVPYEPMPSKKSIIRYAIPLSITTLMIWLQISGFKLFLFEKENIYNFGQLMLGLAIANQIGNIIENIGTQIYFPNFISMLKQDSTDRINFKYFNKMVSDVLIFYTLMIMASIFLSEIFLKIIIGEYYNESIKYIYAGFAIEYSRMLASLFSLGFQINKDPENLIKTEILGVIILLMIILTYLHSDITLKIFLNLLVIHSLIRQITSYRISKIKWMLELSSSNKNIIFLVNLLLLILAINFS